MNMLWRWLLTPILLGFGGDGGGGGGTNAAEEERRKADLRARIDRMYGLKSYGPAPEKVIDHYEQVPDPTSENGQMMFRPVYVTPKINTSALDAEANAATQTMEAEKTKLGEATRSYYADQLGREYTKAERNTRFKLASQGLMGGSEDIFQQGEVKSDRDLGATRVDDAVRRAIAGLTSEREQERLNAVNLVNSGAGDSAVSAAQAGLRNTLSNAESAQKADLFSDLFTSAADIGAAGNVNAQNAALAARYRDRLSTFFPSGGTTSGRVTPSA